MTDQLETDLASGVLTLRFNRPDALNAFRPEMLMAMVDKLTRLPEEVRVVIVEGAGRAFSAGVDLKVLKGVKPQAGKIGDLFDAPAAAAAAAIRNAAVPVIAKVHGFCFTGALEIALHCDVIYTTKTTKFGDTHARFGLRPTWGMTQTLSEAVGVRRARELSFTAKTFTGEQAFEWGLAQAAVDSEQALAEHVAEVCQAIVENSPAAVAAIKDLYRVSRSGLGIEDALTEELARTYPQITDTQTRLEGFGG